MVKVLGVFGDRETQEFHCDVLSDQLCCEERDLAGHRELIQAYCSEHQLPYDTFTLDIEIEEDGFENVCVYTNQDTTEETDYHFMIKVNRKHV